MKKNDYIRKADHKIVAAHELLKGALDNVEKKYDGTRETLKVVRKELRGVRAELEVAGEDLNVAYDAGISLSGKYVRSQSKKAYVPIIDYDIAVVTGLEMTGQLLELDDACSNLITYSHQLMGEIVDNEIEAKSTIDELTKENKKVTRSHINALQKWSDSVDVLQGESDNLMDKIEALRSYAAIDQAEPKTVETNGTARYNKLRKYMEEQRLINKDEVITYDKMLSRLAFNRQDLLKDSSDQEAKAMEIAMGKAKAEDDLSQKTAELTAATGKLQQYDAQAQALVTDARAALDRSGLLWKDDKGTRYDQGLPRASQSAESIVHSPEDAIQLLISAFDSSLNANAQLKGTNADLKEQRDNLLNGNLRMLDTNQRMKNLIRGRHAERQNFIDCLTVMGKDYGFVYDHSKPFAEQAIVLRHLIDASGLAHEMEFAHSKSQESNYQFAKAQWMERAAKAGEQAAIIENMNAELKSKDAEINSSYISKAVSGIKSLFGIGKSKEVKSLEAKVKGLEAVLNDHARNEVEFQKRNATVAPVAQATVSNNGNGFFSYFSAESAKKRAIARNQKIFDNCS